MFKIGSRTVKTAIGTALSIFIAQSLQLANYASAGILTILCVQTTKKKSLQTSKERFLACVLVIGFSAVFFSVLGFSPWVVGLLLLIFIPTVVAFKLQQGIVTSSVILLQFYIEEQLTWALVWNQLSLITIGIGVAFLVNFYMPSLDSSMYELQRKIEEQLKKLLQSMAKALENESDDVDLFKEHLAEIRTLIEKGKALSFRDVENHVLRHENPFYNYFSMREKQFVVLERSVILLSRIRGEYVQEEMTATFLRELSEHVHPGNTAHFYLMKLYQMQHEFESMPLPKSHQEFQSSAALVQFVREMIHYLEIKSHFSGLPQMEKKTKPVKRQPKRA